MRDAERPQERETLREAFTAGWQAGLAVNITSPRVLAVIDSCFELWLREAIDESDVLGLTFRGRHDLPQPSLRRTSPLFARPSAFPRSPSGAETSGPRLNGKVDETPTAGEQPVVLMDEQGGSSVA